MTLERSAEVSKTLNIMVCLLNKAPICVLLGRRLSMNLICTALYNAAPTHPSHKCMFCESSPANYHIEFSHIAALPDPMS